MRACVVVGGAGSGVGFLAQPTTTQLFELQRQKRVNSLTQVIGSRWLGVFLFLAGGLFIWHGTLAADTPVPQPLAPAAPAPRSLYIGQYRVQGGGKLLPPVKIEEAVYPFLGTGMTTADVEQARAALEKAYRDAGYQALAVQIPRQRVKGGVVYLRVLDGRVEKLRVRGARYFSLEEVKAQAPSLAQGRVLDFNDVRRDIATLNQWPDRQVSPQLSAGETPGTVEVDLNVKDTLPLHGNVEINNRYSADTTPLRINGAISYSNLWQLGHTVGASFQVAPEDINEVKVFSGYYLARIPGVDWLSVLVQATRQDSNVSTLGSLDTTGRGEVIGTRAVVTLPPSNGFSQSVSAGMDYKHFDNGVNVAGNANVTPIDYYPFTCTYTATWTKPGCFTELNVSPNFHFRGMGTSQSGFDNNRYDADGSYIYLRGDLVQTRDWAQGVQTFIKVQGQVADEPLVSSEQFSGGGLNTARGYLESGELGDDALFGTIELRSPAFGGWVGRHVNEWRFYVFSDAGFLNLHKPLPEQTSNSNLASVGVGSRLRMGEHFNGSVDVGVPLISEGTTTAGDPLLTFRLWADF